jgi:hypothetical protein
MTYIVAVHDVSDPDAFWSAISQAEIPEGIAVHATYPSGDDARVVCLWEADSVGSVRELVDSTVGDASRNEFFEVNAGHPAALGLPAVRPAG